MKDSITLIDGHVHFYNCFNQESFFNSAWKNFVAQANKYSVEKNIICVLMLTETSSHNWFEKLLEEIKTTRDHVHSKTGWICHQTTGEDESLIAKGPSGEEIIVIAGRQVISYEGLEVLALGTRCTYKDGQPIETIMDQVWNDNALVVLPWAVGKWSGKRGRIVTELVRTTKHNAFLLGDNGGRPWVWPTPKVFYIAKEKGILILPGSDPLPLSWEIKKVGSFGSVLPVNISKFRPAKQIINLLNGINCDLITFGHLEKISCFLRNQISLRIRK